MKLYLEYIILENLILNILIIVQVYDLLKYKINIFRISLTLIIYTIILLIKIKYNTNSILFDLFKSMILIYICFYSNSIKVYIKNLITYFYVCIFNLSIIISIFILVEINIEKLIIKILIYVVSFLICFIFNKCIFKLLLKTIKNNNLIYTLILDNKKYKLFLDTGNNLCNGKGDIILLNINKYISNTRNKLIGSNEEIIVEIKTINKIDYKKGYIFENVVIKKNIIEYKLSKVVLIFVDDNFNNQYDGIISYNTYLEKLGGLN